MLRVGQAMLQKAGLMLGVVTLTTELPLLRMMVISERPLQSSTTRRLAPGTGSPASPKPTMEGAK